jgi:hypothetical protein
MPEIDKAAVDSEVLGIDADDWYSGKVVSVPPFHRRGRDRSEIRHQPARLKILYLPTLTNV